MDMPFTEDNEKCAIETVALSRTYQARTGVFRSQSKEIIALDEVSLSVDRGELFGLVGPNGAGKTTMIKILTTLLLPTSGTAKILGRDVTKNESYVRKRIGFMFGGERGLYWRLSGKDNLRYFAELYGVEPTASKRLIPELLEFVGLADRGDEKVQGYSRGMMQRLHVARILISDPEVLFLDEPTMGMDPIGAKQMRHSIQGLKDLGKTILLTSHDMYEVEALCHRVAMINYGKIIAIDTPANLKSRVADLSVIELELFGPSSEIESRLHAIPNEKSLTHIQDNHLLLKVQTHAGVNELPGLVTALAGVRIGRITVRNPTLQDVYERLIGGIA